MTGSIYAWSTTAASNANADGDVNYAEGQAPSTLNNSSRQVMGRVAEYLADNGGALAAGGTANVITVTANSAFTAYADGLTLALRITADNTGATTLNVNSLGAKSVRKMVAAGEVALDAGDLQATGIAEFRYSTALNSAAGGWLLLNPAIDVPNLVTLTGTQTLTNKTLTSPALTGTPTSPTAAPGTNSTQVATTAYVDTTFAPKASPALTGTPTAPTAAAGTSTTQIATTAFVGSSIIGSGFRNLKVQAISSTQVQVTADALSVENASGIVARLASVNVTADISTSGANGLDTGSEASSTWYYVWVIWNGTTTAALISASATAPTMPSGYTHKLRVGTIRNDASSNLWRTLQYGLRAQVAIGTNPSGLPILASGNAGSITTPTWVAIPVSNFVPSTAAVINLCAVGSNTASDGTAFMIAPNNSYGAYNSTANPPPFMQQWSQQWVHLNVGLSLTLESTSIYWANSAGASIEVALTGWEDNL